MPKFFLDKMQLQDLNLSQLPDGLSLRTTTEEIPKYQKVNKLASGDVLVYMESLVDGIRILSRTVCFADKPTEPAPDQNPALLLPIKDLPLCVRTINCLEAENIYSVDHLVRWSEKELLATPNIGRKSMNEIKEALAEKGLTLAVKKS